MSNMEDAEIDRLVYIAKHSRDVDPPEDEPAPKPSCANCIGCRVSRMESTVLNLMDCIRIHKMSMEKMLNRIILLEENKKEVDTLKRVIDVQQIILNTLVDRVNVLEGEKDDAVATLKMLTLTQIDTMTTLTCRIKVLEDK